jgi:glycosyltransferase involved in cell wall biosynthesis
MSGASELSPQNDNSFMRILLLVQLFQPEPNHLKGLEFAKRLIAQGHHVEVLTCFPNYPGGRVYDGYKIRPFQREVLDGVLVYRVALYPSPDSSSWRRMLTYVTFALSATLFGPFLFGRFDIVHVYQGPSTLVLPGVVLAMTTRAKLVLDIQDLWPESVSSSGMLRNRFLLWALTQWSHLSYRLADAIIVLSQGYKNIICQRGAQEDKVHVVYNWSDESIENCQSEPPLLFDQLISSGKSIIVFAGTMGHAQALDAVISAAEIVQSMNPEIQFVLVGGGVDVDRLKELTARKRLSNVSFVPRVESHRMKSIFSSADALLIHLRKDSLGAVGIPQKTQAYLAAGRPIVMAVDGEAADLVHDAHAGIICSPEDPPGIASAVRALFQLSAGERQAMGINGQRYYREHMSFEIGLNRVRNVYRSALHQA